MPTQKFIGSSWQLWIQFSGPCTVAPLEFTTIYQTDASAKHNTQLT